MWLFVCFLLLALLQQNAVALRALKKHKPQHNYVYSSEIAEVARINHAPEAEHKGLRKGGGKKSTASTCSGLTALTPSALPFTGPVAYVQGPANLQCGSVVNGYDSQYSFTAPTAGTYRFDTLASVNPSNGVACGASGGPNTVLQIRSAGVSSAGYCTGGVLGCNDDVSASNQCSAISLALSQGETVVVEVAQHKGAAFKWTGSFVLNIALVPSKAPPTKQPVKQPTLPHPTASPSVKATPQPSKPTKAPTTEAPTSHAPSSVNSVPTLQPTHSYLPKQNIQDWGLSQCTSPPSGEPCISASTYPLRSGWYDVLGQGAQQDYCRYTSSSGLGTKNQVLWVCALSNSNTQYTKVFPANYDCTNPSSGRDWGCVFYPSGPRSYSLYNDGGATHPVTTVYPVYAGTQWASSSFQSDVITGNEKYYQTIQGTSYADLIVQYIGQPATISFGQSFIDTSAYNYNPNSNDGDVGTRICNVITRNGGQPDPNGYYPLYIDTSRTVNNDQFCAWHSFSYCNGVLITVGFFFDMRNDEGCGGRNAQFGHSAALSALVNVQSHELMEMITDPYPLYDGYAYMNFEQNEIADLCAWDLHQVTLSDGSNYYIQSLWSDNLALQQAGFPNPADGEPGCGIA